LKFVSSHKDKTDATRDGEKSETRNCVLLKFKKKKLCAAALSVGAVLVQSEGGKENRKTGQAGVSCLA